MGHIDTEATQAQLASYPFIGCFGINPNPDLSGQVGGVQYNELGWIGFE